jgi:hypothetical protein
LVADAKGVRFCTEMSTGLQVFANRRRLASLLFRLLESVLSLCEENSDLHLTAAIQNDRACLTFSWTPGPPPRHSPFSPSELGLLLAQAGWQQAGAKCIVQYSPNVQACTIVMERVMEQSSENCLPAPGRSEAVLPNHPALETARLGDVK